MHNQRRDEYKARQRDPKSAAALGKKAQQWNTLSREALQRRKGVVGTMSEPPSPDFDLRTLELTGKLLLVNPDPLYIWNQRRELLLDIPVMSNSDTVSMWNEFDLTANCLRRNPKAYGSWFHRKWTVRRVLSSSTAEQDKVRVLLDTELKLCKDFLSMDERNFHCWNYRRFVVAAIVGLENPESLDGSWDWASSNGVVMGPQIKNGNPKKPEATCETKEKGTSVLLKEWEFTTEKITANFSNYSAFHYRSKLLPLLLHSQLENEESEDAIYRRKLELGRGELELLQQAVFTEPDDQTAWWYHRFIIASFLDTPDRILFHSDSSMLQDFVNLLEEEVSTIQELIEAEDGLCKWGQLALHMLLDKLISISMQRPSDDLGVHSNSMEWKRDQNDCLDKLIEMDPVRMKRYQSMKR